jgi:site-specific recombinase XerD
MGAAADLFCAAKAAKGASPRTVEWYQMILVRAVRRFGEARPVDAIPAAELRAWLLELRTSLAPESIAGYVRGLKAFGNWCAAEEVAAAGGFRGLRRLKVPHRLIAPFSDPELRSLLALADERERALALVLLDTGLRLSELASLRSVISAPTAPFMSWARAPRSGSCRSARAPGGRSSAISRPARPSPPATRSSAGAGGRP